MARHNRCTTTYDADRWDPPTDPWSQLPLASLRGDYATYPCHDAAKDIVMPSFKDPRRWAAEREDDPFFAPRRRLFFFSGDLGSPCAAWRWSLDDPSTISRSAHRACCMRPPPLSSRVVRAPTPPDQQAGRQERRAARACQLLARAAAGGVARRPRRRRPVARGDGPPRERLVAPHVESTAAQTSARSLPGPTRSGRSRPRAAPGFGHPWPVSRLEPWLVVQTGLAPLNTGGTRNTRRGCARPSSAAPSRETGGRAASRRPCSPAACRWS